MIATHTGIETVPPNSLEAECGVIGSILVAADVDGRDLAPTVHLVPSDFYDSRMARIFEEIARLSEAGDVPLSQLLAMRLKDAGALEALEQLPGVVKAVSSPSGCAIFADVVREKATARALRHVLNRAQDSVHENGVPAGALIRSIQENLAGIKRSDAATSRGQSAPVAELLESALSEMEEPLDLSSGEGGCLPWGITELDTRGSFIRPGDFPILAARPGVGKSIFALQWAKDTALRTGRPVIFCSLEMTPKSMVRRLLCNVAGVKDPQERKPSKEHTCTQPR